MDVITFAGELLLGDVDGAGNDEINIPRCENNGDPFLNGSLTAIRAGTT